MLISPVSVSHASSWVAARGPIIPPVWAWVGVGVAVVLIIVLWFVLMRTMGRGGK